MDLRANIRRMLKLTKSHTSQNQNGDQNGDQNPSPDSVTEPQFKNAQPTVFAHPADQQPKSISSTTSTLSESSEGRPSEKLPNTLSISEGSVGVRSVDTSAETLADRDHRYPEIPAADRTRVSSADQRTTSSRPPIVSRPSLFLQRPTPTSEDGEGFYNIGRVESTIIPSPTLRLHNPQSQRSRAPSVKSATVSFSIPSPTLDSPTQPSTITDQSPSTQPNSLREIASVPAASAEAAAPPPIPPRAANHIQPTRMGQRKIWVKRPHATATTITVREDDLVDDVKDKILIKYGNSLGRSYDSPDITIRICGRPEGSRPQDRMLSPEEDMCKTLDTVYPGGQTIEEALLIEPPLRKTPRPSPRIHGAGHHGAYHALDDYRPQESGSDYFPPMNTIVQPPPPQLAHPHELRPNAPQVLHLPEHTRSISILQSGQLPALPSPGAASRRNRPKYIRQQTSSPTILAHGPNAGTAAANAPNLAASHRGTRHRSDSTTSERPHGAPIPPPLPTPPASEAPLPAKAVATPPTPGGRDHLAPRGARPGRKTVRKPTPTNGTATVAKTATSMPASLLDGSVPPINVLIVEDNIINLKLLEAFMKRLRVRWSTAMNGQIAVNKWRAGGFHLVLMDIQLPIMSGLEATKEIRRLERVNGIGVFSNSSPSTPMGGTQMDSLDAKVNGDADAEQDAKDKAEEKAKDTLNMDDGLFKSPVIIVALTASSLQSDRHEALAAGCNDFLTKPVSFVWLERKVKEWGCMQALIDFDGWRKWKDFSSNTEAPKAGAKNGSKSPTLDGVNKTDLAAKAKEKKIKRDKRVSTDGTVSASTKAMNAEAAADASEVGN